MFDNPSFDAHERVLSVFDRDSGLRAFIAVHSTHRGPSAGGCRLWAYPHADEALGDALRLSRAMSYKNAMAGLPFGGGKAVIAGPLDAERRADAFAAFGRAVESLGGAYIAAEDVGVTVPDMEAAAKHTGFITGLTAGDGSVGGDPSPWTARGVRRGIEAVAASALDRSDLEGLHVAVQGVGAVGSNLCRELHERGARLTVTDIDPDRVERICDEFGAERAGLDDILMIEADILAPCALGGVITEDRARTLPVKAVAGGANNQLATPQAGRILFERGVAYAPDYVINAGGIILVCAEYLGDNAEAKVAAAVDAIGERVAEVLDRARTEASPSDLVADAMARKLIGR